MVNVSSALGSFWATHEPSRPASHFPSIVYGSSKAAVSMLTVQYAKAVPEVKFNAVEPGITATAARRRRIRAPPGSAGRGQRPRSSSRAGDASARTGRPARSRRTTASSAGDHGSRNRSHHRPHDVRLYRAVAIAQGADHALQDPERARLLGLGQAGQHPDLDGPDRGGRLREASPAARGEPGGQDLADGRLAGRVT